MAKSLSLVFWKRSLFRKVCVLEILEILESPSAHGNTSYGMDTNEVTLTIL